MIVFEWDKMKSLFLHKLNLTMIEFCEKYPTDNLVPSRNVENVKFEEMKNRILDTTAKFTGAPFTIQRLCELVTNPQNHYQRTDKFLRGLEKNLNVVSSVDSKGNKIFCEPKALFNGTESNGMETGQLRTPEKVNSPFLPPAPNNSPAPTNSPAGAASLFSGTTPVCAPSPLTQSWPKEGSGEGLADIGPHTESSMSMLRAHTQPSTWESEFEGYLLPEKKKPRLDSTVTSLADSRKSSDIPESMPSVSEVFAMHKLTTSPLLNDPALHGSSDCQYGVPSVIKEQTDPTISSTQSGSSVPVSSSPVFETSTSSSLVSSSESVSTETATAVSQSDSTEVLQSSTDCQMSVSAGDSSASEDSSKSDVDTTSTEVSQQVDTDSSSELPAQSQPSDVPDSGSKSDQADNSDIDGEPLAEPADDSASVEMDTSEQPSQVEPSGIDEKSEEPALEPETSECEPREQIEPQPLEDGVDRRDSQGFDVSPNPEEMPADSAVQSEPDSTPVPELPTSPRPDPNVTSSSESTPADDSIPSHVPETCQASEAQHESNVIDSALSPPADDVAISEVASSTDEGDSARSENETASASQVGNEVSQTEVPSAEEQCQSSDNVESAAVVDQTVESTAVVDQAVESTAVVDPTVESTAVVDPAANQQLISQSSEPQPQADTEHQAMETD